MIQRPAVTLACRTEMLIYSCTHEKHSMGAPRMPYIMTIHARDRLYIVEASVLFPLPTQISSKLTITCYTNGSQRTHPFASFRISTAISNIDRISTASQKLGDPGSHPAHSSFGPRVHPHASGSSIGSAVFAGFTRVTTRQITLRMQLLNRPHLMHCNEA